jgi:hypothetical protein
MDHLPTADIDADVMDRTSAEDEVTWLKLLLTDPLRHCTQRS